VLARLAWRDSRTARRRLLLFMSSIALGVAALVAIDSYSANVVQSIREQSRSLLGADLLLSSRRPFPSAIDSLLEALRRTGVAVGYETSFQSMTFVPGTQGTRLVQVRGVSPGVPFYGTIETDPPGQWRALQDAPAALVDPALLVELGAQVGDSLSLGNRRFVIIGTLRNVPGDVGIATALGPRVYIGHRYVPETGLLGFGSRAQYEAYLRLPRSMQPAAVVRAHRATLERARVRARTARDTERSLTENVEQLNRFLGVVALVALLLGGIGVASAVHAYVEEKVDTIATLRCLGATSHQVLVIYLIEAVALGVVGSAIGVGLGLAAQLALPRVLGDFVPVDVEPHLVPGAVAAGIGVGAWVAALFALLPILAVRRVSPLTVLRRDEAPAAARAFHRDPARVGAALALAASVVVIAILRSGTWVRGLLMSGGVAAVVAVLWLSALVVSRVAHRILRHHWPFVVRQGVANLYRPANQTRAVMLSLGFGAFLLGTLYLVQRSLLGRLALGAAETQGNLAFFDVQQDQAGGLAALLRAAGLPVLQEVPIVPMRIAAINGRSTAELARTRPSWALRREYRSTYRDTLIDSEHLTAGRWLGTNRVPGAPAEVSFEQEVAGELGLALGDTVTWDIQGVRLPTVVTSFREVNWVRFEPNFFVVFPSTALADAPKTFVFLTRAPDAASRGRIQRAVVERYPNVSSIDLSLIQEAIGRILEKVSLAVRFMAFFAVATGALVLLSAVAASRRQRLREGVLLKTLGATRAQIARIMVSEYLILGALASATGLLLSTAAAWALARFLFQIPFAPAGLPLAALALGMIALTVGIGLWSSRDVFAESAMAALRAE
jgi:putative ABC transport system permease protein